MPIQRLPFFDVHDLDLTPAIYTLLFTDILHERQGNDLVYEINPFERDHVEGETPYADKAWIDRLARGAGNCFHDHEAMAAFIAKPCTWREALAELQTWLKARGVNEDERVLVKVWW